MLQPFFMLVAVSILVTPLILVQCSEPTAVLSLVNGGKRNGYALQLSGSQLSGYLRTLQNVPESFYKNPHIIADMDESSVPEVHASPSNRRDKVLSAVRFDAPHHDSEFLHEEDEEEPEESFPTRKHLLYDDEEASIRRPFRRPEKFADYKASPSREEFIMSRELPQREFVVREQMPKEAESREYDAPPTREYEKEPKSYPQRIFLKKETFKNVHPKEEGAGGPKVYTMRELLRELGEKEENQREAEDYALREYVGEPEDSKVHPTRSQFQDDTSYDHPPTLISDLQPEFIKSVSRKPDENTEDLFGREMPSAKEYTTRKPDKFSPTAPKKKNVKEDLELKSVRDLLNTLIKQVERMQVETARFVASTTSRTTPAPVRQEKSSSEYVHVYRNKNKSKASANKKKATKGANSKTVYLKAHDIVKLLTGEALGPDLYPSASSIRPAYPISPMGSPGKMLPPFLYPYPMFGGPYPQMGFYAAAPFK